MLAQLYTYGMSDTTDTDTEDRPVPFVDVWVCPNGHYYGASSAGDLSTQMNIRSSMRNLHTEDPSEWGKVTGPRSVCQICRAESGPDAEPVERELVRYVRADMVDDLVRKAMVEASP